MKHQQALYGSRQRSALNVGAGHLKSCGAAPRVLEILMR